MYNQRKGEINSGWRLLNDNKGAPDSYETDDFGYSNNAEHFTSLTANS